MEIKALLRFSSDSDFYRFLDRPAFIGFEVDGEFEDLRLLTVIFTLDEDDDDDC